MSKDNIRMVPHQQDPIPSYLGLQIVSQFYNNDYILRLARSGTHNINPYHNIVHELQHAYWSNACAINSTREEAKQKADLSLLCLASMFHDHNHSGGKTSDSENIRRAVEFATQHFTYERLASLIEVTEFSKGEFVVEPVTFEEKCMRDADLMSIYSIEGRKLLIGLLEEMGHPLRGAKKDSVVEMLQRNADFLQNAEMYTWFGRTLKADHLAESIKEFEREVWSRYRMELYDDE